MDTTERVAKMIAKYAHDPDNPSRTVSAAYRRLAQRDRPHTKEAVQYALARRWIEVEGNRLFPGPFRPEWVSDTPAWMR